MMGVACGSNVWADMMQVLIGIFVSRCEDGSCSGEVKKLCLCVMACGCNVELRPPDSIVKPLLSRVVVFYGLNHAVPICCTYGPPPK